MILQNFRNGTRNEALPPTGDRPSITAFIVTTLALIPAVAELQSR